MSRGKKSVRDELRFIDLIEQSIFLVRSTFSSALWIYYLSTIPFIILFINFWSITSSRLVMPFEISGYALLLTLLFWLKVSGQSLYCHQLLAQLIDEQTGISVTTFFCTAINSLFGHSLGLLSLILSSLMVAPLGYVVTFSQYLYVFGAETGIGIGDIVKKSYHYASQEGFYHHLLLLYIILLYGVLFINLGIVIYFLPQLIKILFNIDTVFTISFNSFFNTTFLLIVLCITYLIADPIVKGLYVTLAFYKKSSASGDDILAECRRLSIKRGFKRVGLYCIALAFVLPFLLSTPVMAANIKAPVYEKAAQEGSESEICRDQLKEMLINNGYDANSVDYTWMGELIKRKGLNKKDVERAGQRLTFIKEKSSEMKKRDLSEDWALGQVISDIGKSDLYRWRYKIHKREKRVEKQGNGFIMQMLKDLLNTLNNWLHPVLQFMKKIGRRIIDFLFKPSQKNRVVKEREWMGSEFWPVIVTIGIVVLFLLLILFLFRLNQKEIITSIKKGEKKMPDLSKEDVDATQLGEDEWLKLVEEFKIKGNLRFALRSAFLAILSFLNTHNYLRFEKYKTNYNYLSEILQNSRNRQEYADSFLICIELFERTWYGRYPVSLNILEEFEKNRQMLMSGL